MFGAAFYGQTRSDFNENYPFARLHTWNFVNYQVNTSDKFGSNEIWDMALRENLTFQLRRLGFTEATDYPDFYVRFRLGTKERERLRIYHDDWGGFWPGYWPGYSYYWGGWWSWHPGWGGTSTVYHTTYDESTLVVDMLDGRTRDLIWRGYDRREMSDHSEKTLRKSVDKLMGRLAKDIHRDRKSNP
jgi:hypothetical protein